MVYVCSYCTLTKFSFCRTELHFTNFAVVEFVCKTSPCELSKVIISVKALQSSMIAIMGNTVHIKLFKQLLASVHVHK